MRSATEARGVCETYSATLLTGINHSGHKAYRLFIFFLLPAVVRLGLLTRPDLDAPGASTVSFCLMETLVDAMASEGWLAVSCMPSQLWLARISSRYCECTDLSGLQGIYGKQSSFGNGRTGSGRSAGSCNLALLRFLGAGFLPSLTAIRCFLLLLWRTAAASACLELQAIAPPSSAAGSSLGSSSSVLHSVLGGCGIVLANTS